MLNTSEWKIKKAGNVVSYCLFHVCVCVPNILLLLFLTVTSHAS